MPFALSSTEVLPLFVKAKNRSRLIALLFTPLTLSFLATFPATAQNGPTMGWSSWNTYGVNINEALIRRQADAMVSKGLKAVGFDHINIDDGFFGGRNTETGELLIHPTRFPNGLKPVADYIHSKGLKAGIYSDAGANTCGNMYNGDNLSVNVGFYNYDQHDADFYFLDCGFDFVKVDFCGGDAPQNKQHLALDPQERYTAISEAIKNTGRTDVRMNVCRWDYPGTWVHDIAFSWRTTHDINDSWNSVKGILAENLYMSAYCYDGRFNDMDMLEVGRSMSTEEDKTHFGMWCIMNSPLLIGCDLTNIKATTLTLLKNTELIALNQDTLYQQAYIATLTDGCYVLVKDLETLNGKKRAFAVYNPNDASKTVKVKFSDIDLSGNVKLRDVFQKKDLGEFTDEFEIYVPNHGTRIYVAEAETRLERTKYEAETAYISDYQEIKNNQTEKTGIYEQASFCSSGYKAGWLGCSEQNDLVWRDVYSYEGGEYLLTIGFISGENRSITVDVNGQKVQTVNVNSGGWQTVGKKTIDVSLQKGKNIIRLSNPANWMPDIDYIELKSNTSEINNIEIQHPATGEAYNLQGQKVNADNAHHTVVIQNGRKVLKK
ncbi:MAG: alpha-galactosidase [Prevotella sp.]|nr:alpha-galactosidase [Prevotella sp.]